MTRASPYMHISVNSGFSLCTMETRLLRTLWCEHGATLLVLRASRSCGEACQHLNMHPHMFWPYPGFVADTDTELPLPAQASAVASTA